MSIQFRDQLKKQVATKLQANKVESANSAIDEALARVRTKLESDNAVIAKQIEIVKQRKTEAAAKYGEGVKQSDIMVKDLDIELKKNEIDSKFQRKADDLLKTIVDSATSVGSINLDDMVTYVLADKKEESLLATDFAKLKQLEEELVAMQNPELNKFDDEIKELEAKIARNKTLISMAM